MIKTKVTVIELKPDFDPTGREYVWVSLGFKFPIVTSRRNPIPQATGYKHLLHIFIPREQWNDQYKLWEEYTLIIKDNGELELK